MTSSQLAKLKLSIVCMLALGASAVVPAAAAASSAGPYYAEASLATAAPTATDKDVDGVKWTCEGDKCVGTMVGRRSVAGSRMDECRKVAAVIGRLASFSSRGKELTKRDLDTCNRSAR